MSDTIVSLRRKIDSAGDLLSVVRTMKTLAASNIGQYEHSVRALGHYYRSVQLGLCVFFRKVGRPHLTTRAVGRREKTIQVVVFGSDQGLVGRFNDVVAEFALEALAKTQASPKVWAVGERVHGRLADAGVALAGLYAVPSSVQAITPLVGRILMECEADQSLDEAAELIVFYNSPSTNALFEPVQKRILPLDETWLRELAELPWPSPNLPEVVGDRAVTLRAMIREYLFVSLFRACAESLASENSSRLAAMQRAEKNIEELLHELNGDFHRIRQSGIDAELFDVISGFDAQASPRAR